MSRLFFISLVLPHVLFAAEYGQFMIVKGKVKIESAQSSVDAKVGSKIQVGETVVTENDSRAKIVMTDRNIINVSPNTKLKIEKYTNSGADKNVNLNLIEGKVRNDVEQKYDNKNSKFQVRTATAVAGVRGTQFVTSFDKDTKVTEVITLKGEVSFQSIASGDAPKGDPVIVEKGEKSQTKDGGTPVEPVKVPEKEIKQIDSDTSVKKDPATNQGGAQGGTGANGGQAGGSGKKDDGKKDGDGAADGAGGPGGPGPQDTAANSPPKGPLDNMNKRNGQIINDATNRRFDKSKVKIITQPSP